MYKGGSSRLFPAILILIVIVVAVVALVAVGRALLGGGSKTTTPEASPARQALVTTDADHSIRMSVRGPLVAEENFRSYQVDISPVSRSLMTYKGYQHQLIDTKEYINNTEAYTEFVHALDSANFLKETKLTEEQDDTRGVCETGRLYTFEILEAQTSVKRLWTSSCGNSKGSFKGNAEQVRTLFLTQIPDSSAVLRTVDLSL